MRILILTQNEHLYLPHSFATVCRERRDDICCIVCAPAMSTHGGPLPGLLKHVRVFGPRDSLRIAWRVVSARIKARLIAPKPQGPFYSIANVARAFEIPYYAIELVKSAALQRIIDRHGPELLVSISCPQIIGKKVRERFARGCINVHGAPLPKYRGLMPAFWELKNNETRTAATVHELDSKLDNGAILLQREVEIAREDTWDGLVRKTKAAGVRALLEVLAQIEDGSVERQPNREEDATYFSFPTAADRREFLRAGRRFF